MFGTSAITPIVAIIFITGSAIINATSGLNVEAEKVAKDIQEEVKQKGLMSKPEETE